MSRKGYECEPGVLVAVVMKGIVAGKGQENTKAWTQREEDLCSCIKPNLKKHEWSDLSVKIFIHPYHI